MLRYVEGQFLLKYLGVPLVWRELCTNDCLPLIQQLPNYLDNWKSKALSYGGWIQLANWVLFGKLLYWFQLMQLPTGVIKKER